MFFLQQKPIKALSTSFLITTFAVLTACSGGGGSGKTEPDNNNKGPVSDVSIVTPSILKSAGEEVRISGKKLKDAIVTFESNNLSPTTQTDTLIKVAFPPKAAGDYQFDIDGKKFDISYFSPYTKIVSGWNHGCGILPSKKVECWGSNTNSKIDGSTESSIYSPKAIANLENVTDLALGQYHSCALLTDKTVKCWGRKDDGRLGYVGTGSQATPARIGSLTNVTSISAGSNHTCAIIGKATATTDSTVKCWGANRYKQINNSSDSVQFAPVSVGSAMTKAIQVSAGVDSTCFLLHDQTVKCRGRNNYGQAASHPSVSEQPGFATVNLGGANTATQITSGASHHCALKTDKTVMCWGLNSLGQLGDNTTATTSSSGIKYAVAVRTSSTSSTPLPNVKGIGATRYSTCALLTNGSMKCWGGNNSRLLGDGANANSSTPVDVQHVSNATDLVLGGSSVCAVFASGMPKCWGSNVSGALGVGKPLSVIGTPTEMASTYSQQLRAVAGLDTVIAASGGDSFNCALLADGHIKCWGDNGRGQLGNGSTTASTTPVEVTGISNATHIASGHRHSCAVLDDGTIKCWGQNRYGQLGNNTTTDSSQPAVVNNINNAVQVVAAAGHTCALLKTKQVKCWGESRSGEYALPTGKTGHEPVDIAGLTNVTKLSANMGYHTCALTEAGKVMCWGSNHRGQLGDGSATSGSNSTPKAVVGISDAIDVAVGISHSCALLKNKTVKCWGDHNEGALGVGDKGHSYLTATPELVIDLTGVKKIIASNQFSCAVLENGSAKCWGRNSDKQLGDGTNTMRKKPVSMSVIKGKVDDIALSDNGSMVIQGTLITTIK